ncbi:MAG: tetratricopeptide repeat protein [Clostridia bacterium]|nr:tetratricopeptide repeat protein [Clostridia bacterium]
MKNSLKQTGDEEQKVFNFLGKLNNERFKNLIETILTRYYLKRGLKLKERGDLPRAVQYFKRILNIRSDDHHALNNTAVCYSMMGEYKIALSYFGKACILKDDSDIIINAVITAARAKKFRVMDYYCKKLEGLGHVDPEEYMGIAEYLMQGGHHRKALGFFDLYLGAGGQDKFKALHGKGICLARLNTYGEALYLANILLGSKSAKNMGWELKGFIFDTKGQYAEAVDCYNIAYGFEKVSQG